MSVKGSPITWFRAALDNHSLAGALAEAPHLPRISTADALSLCLLFLEQAPARYDRAAVRWAARLALERPNIGLDDLALLVAGLRALPTPSWEAGEAAIAAVTRRCGLPEASIRLERWRRRFRTS